MNFKLCSNNFFWHLRLSLPVNLLATFVTLLYTKIINNYHFGSRWGRAQTEIYRNIPKLSQSIWRATWNFLSFKGIHERWVRNVFFLFCYNMFDSHTKLANIRFMRRCSEASTEDQKARHYIDILLASCEYNTFVRLMRIMRPVAMQRLARKAEAKGTGRSRWHLFKITNYRS